MATFELRMSVRIRALHEIEYTMIVDNHVSEKFHTLISVFRSGRTPSSFHLYTHRTSIYLYSFFFFFNVFVIMSVMIAVPAIVIYL